MRRAWKRRIPSGMRKDRRSAGTGVGPSDGGDGDEPGLVVAYGVGPGVQGHREGGV